MDTKNTSETFVTLRQAAARHGVPAAWLKAEAEAGRVPHLRTGRRLMFNCAAVETALLERSQAAIGEKAGGK